MRAGQSQFSKDRSDLVKWELRFQCALTCCCLLISKSIISGLLLLDHLCELYLWQLAAKEAPLVWVSTAH